MVSKVIGIISYMPVREPDRTQRWERLCRLMNQLDKFLPGIPIIIIAQNWDFDMDIPPHSSLVVSNNYKKLGIIKARQALREEFLESDYDYLIMFDDDAILEYLVKHPTKEYIKAIDSHPNGFMFLQYEASQLNGCAISRYIYEKEPMVDVDAEKNEGFEDAIYSWLLHNKYPQNEFTCNAVKCIHFRNPKELIPSTWAREGQKDWKKLRSRTAEIKQYITEHKELPPDLHK